VIVAWADLLPELSVASRNAVQEAQPISVDDDVVVFGVSPRLFEAARPRFRREADTIRDALSARLGHTIRFNLVAHEGFSGVGAVAPSSRPDTPSERSEVIEKQAVQSSSPASLITERLGASVIEERPRE
jgi:hypothetical protein